MSVNGLKGAEIWSLRILLIISFFIYLSMLMFNSVVFEKSVLMSLKERQTLIVPLVIAIFLGTAMKNIFSQKKIKKYIRKNRTMLRNVINTVIIGSILPPCPYVSYPVIEGFYKAGMDSPAIINMLVATTVVETGQLFAGFVVFGVYIEGLRILISFIGVMITGIIYYN
ncbi:hypothetical protein DRQ09_06300, partial [candidate division KSB1 bacterium]